MRPAHDRVSSHHAAWPPATQQPSCCPGVDARRPAGLGSEGRALKALHNLCRQPHGCHARLPCGSHPVRLLACRALESLRSSSRCRCGCCGAWAAGQVHGMAGVVHSASKGRAGGECRLRNGPQGPTGPAWRHRWALWLGGALVCQALCLALSLRAHAACTRPPPKPAEAERQPAALT